MRRAALVGTIISAAILVLGLMLVPIVGANEGAVPAFQGDATATATADAGATPTTDGGAAGGTTGGVTDATATATAGDTTGGGTTGGAAATATETATAAAAGDTTGGGATTDETATAGAAGGTTDGTSPGNLPDTGANDGPSAVMLTIAVALLIFGVTAVATLLARRRGTQA